MDQDGLCRAIDALENATTMLVNGKTLPDGIHVQSLRALLPDIVRTLKDHAGYDAYVGVDDDN